MQAASHARSEVKTEVESEASPADRAACRAAIRGGSKSFFAASLLLPARVRHPAYGLYAFCRLADDAVDGARDAQSRGAAVEHLAGRLTRAASGRPADHPADRALAAVMEAHAIPPALPRALLEGLAWDAEGRRYADLAALTAYAARVAGTVGAMMTLIMGSRDPNVLARACDLGVAMQFTNIARDVGEDARAGRLYLPLAWMREAGLDPEAWLAAPVHGPALAGVVARLLSEADRLYARAQAGIAGLPADCRPAIRAAALIYAEIGRAVAANGHDAVGARARVGTPRKLALLARAAAPERAAPVFGRAPPLPETAFLVAAVAGAPGPARRLPAWWDLRGRALHALDLIETWEIRDARARAALP
ncbi:phytoene/squalene synthase family protein [Methylobacterium radiodurans]|uniref:Phytoene synthase n=1 Tax=Methylobacterium radiodurans TaxID=2202828 RepID=A0A2U8VVJ3_9HYPH|nr:phytoene/squalene synthase family protein [Methylobacterium radiodurans]AWN37370.1 phytoene synthase [Methylobacterium radiodurans]